MYYSMNRFLEALGAARLDGSYLKWLNLMAKTPLLILDDFGLKSLDPDSRLTLLQILEDRYRSGRHYHHFSAAGKQMVRLY